MLKNRNSALFRRIDRSFVQIKNLKKQNTLSETNVSDEREIGIWTFECARNSRKSYNKYFRVVLHACLVNCSNHTTNEKLNDL